MEQFSVESWTFEALRRIALLRSNLEFGFSFRVVLILVVLTLALICGWSSFSTYIHVCTCIHDCVQVFILLHFVFARDRVTGEIRYMYRSV